MMFFRTIFLFLLITFAPSIMAASEGWRAQLQSPTIIGEGTLKVFVWEVYDIRLLSDGAPFSWQRDFVLEFAYKRELTKDRVIEASIKEMRRQKNITDSQIERWQEYLQQGIKSVQPATKAALLFTDKGTLTFYYDGKAPVTVTDAAFARAFMNIWLGADTSKTALREALLGLS
jgi:hypothetical protein